MRDCDHLQTPIPNPKDDAVREASERKSSAAAAHGFADIGRAAEQRNDATDLLDNEHAQTAGMRLARQGRFAQLATRRRMKLGPHLLSCARNSSKTCSAGMLWTVPSSSSLQRLATSLAQAASRSGSGGPSRSSSKVRSSRSLSSTFSSRTSRSSSEISRVMRSSLRPPSAACNSATQVTANEKVERRDATRSGSPAGVELRRSEEPPALYVSPSAPTAC
jgi:hypothetical protein